MSWKVQQKGEGTVPTHRSAITGRFVTASTAKRHPRTTVTESNKRKGSGK